MRKKTLIRQVGVLFSEVTYEELIRITNNVEISLSEFIRRIVEEKINKKNNKDKCNE